MQNIDSISILGILASRDNIIRESWVRVMEARLVREELRKCHKFEGVNHYQSCKELAEKYVELLKDAKVCPIVNLLYLSKS